jgi:asparagine synthase (glutamine-hydrolysing)
MSGLAALLHRDGRPVDLGLVRAMLEAVPYRGPDGMGVWRDGPLGLGHAKLAVTPEDALDHQPLVSPRTGCVLICDARLDNRADVLARLPESLAPGASDAELILRCYETWQLGALPRLLGDFAFVLWDPRKERLLCARDTSGQRSLFYRIDQRTFAAASEIHQLLQDPEVAVAPNEERIRDFLVPLNMFQNEKQVGATFFKGIQALPAGHALTVEPQGTRVWQYWELAPPPELRYRADEDYAQHFRALFFEIVRPRLRTAGPLGALLSGGLDSTSVVSAAHELYRSDGQGDRGFTSFSVLFEGMECDEREFIQDVQDKYGFTARTIPCGDFGGRVELVPQGFQESPNMGLRQGRDALFGAASRAGVRALLTGDIADACIGGSPLVFDSLLRHGHLRALRAQLQAYRQVSDERWRTIVALYCLVPLLPRSIQRWVRSMRLRRAFQRLRPRLLPSWMTDAARADLSQRHLELSLQTERDVRFASPARALSQVMLYPPAIARHPVPWPVELWQPFADRRLHEFLLAIPPEQLFAPHPDTDEFYAGSKRLLRSAMRGILPESVRTRTAKTYFGDTIEHEIVRQWPSFEAVFGPTAPRSEIAEFGLVDRDQFWSRLEAARSGTTGNDAVYLLQLAGLETWLRTLRLPRPQLVTVPTPANLPGRNTWSDQVLVAPILSGVL